MSELRDSEVTAAKLAEWLGCSRYRALRKLQALAKLRPDIVHVRGRTTWAAASELAPYIPELRDTPLHRHVRTIDKRLDDLERRVDVLAQAK